MSSCHVPTANPTDLFYYAPPTSICYWSMLNPVYTSSPRDIVLDHAPPLPTRKEVWLIHCPLASGGQRHNDRSLMDVAVGTWQRDKYNCAVLGDIHTCEFARVA